VAVAILLVDVTKSTGCEGRETVPIYEYLCENSACSHRFEMRQGFDAEPVAVCPKCRGRARRRISPVPVIFKGSGWYVTDYARKNPTLTGDGEKGSSSRQEEKESSPSLSSKT
jgi:putative FmdB family regulatory protein